MPFSFRYIKPATCEPNTQQHKNSSVDNAIIPLFKTEKRKSCTESLKQDKLEQLQAQITTCEQRVLEGDEVKRGHLQELIQTLRYKMQEVAQEVEFVVD